MTLAIIADIENLLGKLKAQFSPAVQADIKAAENEGHAIVTDAVSYIKANGLQDLEQIAMTIIGGMAPGASWTGAVLPAIKAQAITDGVKLIEGAEAVVAAKVQADLIAVGKLGLPVPSTTGATA